MNTKILRTLGFFNKNIFQLNDCTCLNARESRLLGSVNVVWKDKRNTHTTVDVREVEKHTQLMTEWWNPIGPMKALHSFNLIRVPFVRDGLVKCSPSERNPTPLKDKKILDVGCGGGILAEPLARLGANVTGIDASKELIALAQLHSSENPKLVHNKPTYYHTTIEEHASEYSDHYDGIVASEIIEHVDNKELFVKSCIKALKANGRIFFTTPNRTRLAQVAGIYVAEYILNFVPKGTHQYDKFITPTELTFLLERNDCHVELIYGIIYNVLTNRWQWINSQACLFALQAVKVK